MDQKNRKRKNVTSHNNNKKKNRVNTGETENINCRIHKQHGPTDLFQRS